MIELLDAVDELTKPQTVTVTQTVEGVARTRKIVHPPRLVQLEAAIRDSMTAAGSSTALASERNLINTSALYDWLLIKTQVESMARLVGSKIDRQDVCSTLRGWYVGYIATRREDDSVAYFVRQISKWVAQIDAVLDPPRVKDLPDACPVCDATAWWNPRTKEQYPRPLVITFRDGPTAVQDARGLCRACDEVFTVRELAYAIEQKAETA